MQQQTIKQSAVDEKAGMTLEELSIFVQRALRADIPPEAIINVRVGWHSEIKSIEVHD